MRLTSIGPVDPNLATWNDCKTQKVHHICLSDKMLLDPDAAQGVRQIILDTYYFFVEYYRLEEVFNPKFMDDLLANFEVFGNDEDYLRQLKTDFVLKMAKVLYRQGHYNIVPDFKGVSEGIRVLGRHIINVPVYELEEVSCMHITYDADKGMRNIQRDESIEPLGYQLNLTDNSRHEYIAYISVKKLNEFRDGKDICTKVFNKETRNLAIGLVRAPLASKVNSVALKIFKNMNN